MHRSAHGPRRARADTILRDCPTAFHEGRPRLSRRPIVEARIRWPRGRFWRPGEPITLTEGETSVTYLLRGVTRDADPHSGYATVLLEPIRTATETVEDVASAAS